jgi:hypothetical protein
MDLAKVGLEVDTGFIWLRIETGGGWPAFVNTI